ncbi:Nicotinamidase-related amidase (PncA) (PDB:1ILW) [Commensalibacter communis]|uniref:bifunctional nicotinamidase/pyrazinamidase n=1 Tax=Commensalibacter communis TaxID=2972786 RepID=UPI0022FF6DAE|nr:bifunctional nicotinamidase/pyrazinamidase [Commensalibacter communis]CAI3924948.1 Nicotinamidase-related amidase (PncA) (PDB:1ILW) [Commensalibacter communis]CAI3934194.1 Nicotinamidase-related amidase (PncA) (PDB:1ILW) [Commensalibacter communis]
MTMHINQQTDILAVIDVQNDFLPGGALGVKDGDQIIPVINHLLTHRFQRSFATQDWHPKNHISFAENHIGAKPYDEIELPYGQQTLWPTHAMQNTFGAELSSKLQQQYFQMILRKGWHQHIDSYSAFYENDQTTSTGLVGWLRNIGIQRLFFTGLAEDFCVAYSAYDAIQAGFETYIIQDATKPVNLTTPYGKTTAELQREKLLDLGVKYINSFEIFNNK